MKNYKKIIFIGLMAILSNAIVVSSDQQPLEEVSKVDNVDQVVISEKMATEMKEILNKEIKRLTDEKAFLQGFFYKYFAPALYGTGSLAITGFQIFCLASHCYSYKICECTSIFDHFLSIKKSLLRMRKKNDDFFVVHFLTTFPLVLILLQTKIFNVHKQKTAEKIQKIDAEIERTQAIVAQLQQQQQ